MSSHAAQSLLSRIHLREMAMAAHYPGFASDVRSLATANPEQAEAAYMARRAELCAAYGINASEQRKPFAFANGVAIIPIHGTLINRFGYSWGYVTGYNFIRQQVAAAAQDADVTGILFDVNSYGGEAAGCFECSADIKRLAAGKPTMAMIDSNCYSAAYALACGADRIVATPSGGAGSIGVVAMHVSFEKMLDEAGVKVSFIYAGDHKVDGNPYQDLSAEVKADIQASINKSYDAFVAVVAKGRGMDEKAVRATEARTFRADDAKSLGLIDAVAAPSEAVQAFLGELSGSNPQPRKKEDAMSDAATKPGAEQQANPDQIKADAIKAERTRVSGIQNCEEAKGRSKLASHLAFNTSMSIDEAKAILAAAPVEAAGSDKPNPFTEAMDKSGNPKVGADGGNGGGEQQSAVSFLVASACAAGVKGFEKASA